MKNAAETISNYINSQDGITAIMRGWAKDYTAYYLANALRKAYMEDDDMDAFFEAINKIKEEWGL